VPEAMNHKFNFRNSPDTLRRDFSTINISAILCALGLVVVGFLIYILFRPDSIRVFRWFSFVGLETPVLFIRDFSMQFIPSIPEWSIYSLPNGLWSFSYALIISHLWLTSNSVIKYFWLFSIPLVVFSYETLQYLEVIPGTFCYQDLVFCFLGMSLGITTSFLLIRRSQ